MKEHVRNHIQIFGKYGKKEESKANMITISKVKPKITVVKKYHQTWLIIKVTANVNPRIHVEQDALIAKGFAKCLLDIRMMFSMKLLIEIKSF